MVMRNINTKCPILISRFVGVQINACTLGYIGKQTKNDKYSFNLWLPLFHIAFVDWLSPVFFITTGWIYAFCTISPAIWLTWQRMNQWPPPRQLRKNILVIETTRTKAEYPGQKLYIPLGTQGPPWSVSSVVIRLKFTANWMSPENNNGYYICIASNSASPLYHHESSEDPMFHPTGSTSFSQEMMMMACIATAGKTTIWHDAAFSLAKDVLKEAEEKKEEQQLKLDVGYGM